MTQLDPEIAAVVAEKAAAAPAYEPPVEEMRANHEAETPIFCGTGEAVAEVVEEEIAGVPVRRYVPEGAAEGARIAYFHGGGWVIGSLDSYDPICRALANRSGVEVIGVGYRLAPEHPAPAALDDCRAVAHALSAERLAVAGDSAGGYLAARVAQEIDVSAALLVYPVIDPACQTPSFSDYEEGYGLTAAGMRRFWRLYGEQERVAERTRARRVVVVLADHDVLHDEGHAWATAVGAELRRYEGTVHGFFRWLARCELSRRAVADAGAALRAALG